MHLKRNVIIRFLEFACNILPILFWVLLIFGFEDGYVALSTLLAGLIHELGHLVYLHLNVESGASLRGVENGFRIKSGSIISYKKQIWLYLSGACANIIVSIFCLVISFLFGDFFIFFGLINLLTAMSNLLPVEGYDGYGAIKSYLEDREFPDAFLRGLSLISTSLIFIFTLLSLYLMDRLDGGYWIFAIFSITMIKHMGRSLDKF